MRTPVLIRGLGWVCAIALAVPALAHADTALLTGYGSAGNQLNPSASRSIFPAIRMPFRNSTRSRGPRPDFSIRCPMRYPDLPRARPIRIGGAWVGYGSAASELSARTPTSALLNRYGEFSSGPLLGSAGFLLENHRTAYYFSGLVENAGRNDQYYQLNGGRYGDFNLTLFFDSVPHLYSTEARSIWNGAGTDNLTLRGGLVPGASTPAQVTAVADAAPLTELSVTREKAGVSLKYTPSKSWEILAQLSNEWRDGTQPISATFGYPFENGATQIIQPIHYRTFDVATTARYKSEDGTMAANLIYTGSFFNNTLSALRWQNPGLAEVRSGSYIPPEGQLSLPPSNSFNSLKGDASMILSPDLRFSASASYGLMRQDDALLSPTIGTGIIPGAGGPINLADWNTTAALSQLHAHAAIDVFNAFAQLQYTVTSKFKLDFELRDRNEMNHTNYLAYNPLTGQYGYIAIDGGLAPFYPPLSGVYQPNARGSVVQIRNMPFANDNLQLTAKGDYRLDNHLKLEASYTHNSIEHSVREVPDASDNRFRLQLDGNGFDWGTVRVSYEFGSLSGSDYVSNPYTPYYSTSLPGYIPATPDGDPAFTLLNLRKFDVGDRTEHIVHAQSNYIVSPRTDFQLSGDYKGDFYDAQYGLRASSSFDINADLNYQMSTATVLTGFFSYQSLHRSIANINPTGAVDNGAAGGADYPLANAWHEQLASDNIAAGLTARQNWGKISLDANYIYTHGDSAIGYSFASTGAFFNILTAAQAGSAFPDIVFDSHTFQTNARYQASPTLSYILLYRFDYEHLDDFHYNGLAPVISNNTYLGVVPENFTVQTVGFSVQYTF